MKQLLIYISILALIGCTGSHHPQKGDGDKPDTIYTEPAAMSIHIQEPKRALVMIDSAVIVGNVTPQRAEYLKAIIQYGGENDYPLSRQTCLDLLKQYEKMHKSQTLTNDDSTTILHTYTLLVAIEYLTGNNAALVRYATEASRLAHILDSPSDIGEMESSIARVMAEAGKTDESIDRMNKICDELRQMNSFKGITAYFSASKELLHTLLDNNRFTEMVPVCQAMLERIDELDKHPERFSDIADGFDASEFVDMARGKSYAFLTVAYARQYTAVKDPPMELTPAVRAQLLQKARAAEAAVRQTQWSHTLDCEKMMTAAYHYLGEFDKFDEAMARIDSTKTDTITNNHLISLYQRYLAARMRGQTEQAFWFIDRATNLRDSLDLRDQHNQLNELATVYHLQEEQLARKQAEADARFFRLLTLAIVVGLAAAIAFAIYFFYKRRQTAEKNKALVRMIDEMHQPHESKYEEQDTGDDSPEDMEGEGLSLAAQDAPQKGVKMKTLFQRLTSLVHDEHLYRDIALDRETVCERLGIDRHTLNQVLNTHADGLSLPAYINNVRVDVAYEMLHQTEQSISDIAAAVGFTPQNLRIQFKKHFGITPTEYRRSKG